MSGFGERVAAIRAAARATPARRRARRVASVVCVVIATLFVFLTVLQGYVVHALVDKENFADRAVATLEDDNVREYAARQITEQAVLRARRDLIAIEPVIESAASSIIGTGAFQGIFRRAVVEAHSALFSKDRDSVVLQIADVAVLLEGVLQKFQPKLASKVPDDLSTKLLDLTAEGGPLDFAQAAENTDDIFVQNLIILLVFALLALLLSMDRRRTSIYLGIGIALVGVVIVIGYGIGRRIVLGKIDDQLTQDAAGAAWDSFLLDFRSWGWALTATGVVIVASAASLIRTIDVDDPLARAWKRVTATPERSWVRVLHALVLLAIGVWLALDVWGVLQLAFLGLAIYVIYRAVAELMSVVAKPREEVGTATERLGRGVRRISPAAAAIVVALLGAGVVAVVLLTSGGASEDEAEQLGNTCNGSEALCNRAINKVVYPAAHNAQSSAAYRPWINPNQERTLTEQLDKGIRALLIDTAYGEPTRNGKVRTDFEGGGNAVKKLNATLGPKAREAAERLRESVGYRAKGSRRAYSCHAFCELGSIELEKALGEIKDWSAAHPNNVIVLGIEDVVTPKDTAKAFEQSGLADYVWKGKQGPPWPTLRELIDDGTPVVVMLERQGGKVPWLRPMYDFTAEVPYAYKKPSDFNCAQERGPKRGEFFLLNHWIEKPEARVSQAEKVNKYDVLLSRARRCRLERKMLPNFIAVDFANIGDVVKVANTLNRIDKPAKRPSSRGRDNPEKR